MSCTGQVVPSNDKAYGIVLRPQQRQRKGGRQKRREGGREEEGEEKEKEREKGTIQRSYSDRDENEVNGGTYEVNSSSVK